MRKGGEQMEFDYFYGPEDAEQYQFYRIPKLLITSEQFKDISVEVKLLYGLMLDRLSFYRQRTGGSIHSTGRTSSTPLRMLPRICIAAAKKQ